MPGGPGRLELVGPLVEPGPVLPGVVGGWMLTGGSVVGLGSSRWAVVIAVDTANDPASSVAPTHHSRAVDRACRARTIPIRRLALIPAAISRQR